MSVTLKDLAKASGVSVGTVSRALNGKKEVSAKTADRIRRLAGELGYTPNRAGRALSAQKSLSYIGVVLPGKNNPFFDDIRRGIGNAARELQDLGVEVIVDGDQDWEAQAHLEAIGRLERRGCNAFILCAADTPEIRGAIGRLAGENIPVVLINNDCPEAGRVCYVGPDYYRSGQTAAALLDKCRQGQELRILVIAGGQNHPGYRRRVEGFVSELNRRGCRYELVQTVDGRDRDIDTQEIALRAFAAHPGINCVYMATGSGVAGLGAAIIADGRRGRLVIACDEIPATRELVKNDIIDFVVCQQAEIQGYQAVKKVHEYLSNKLGGRLDDYIVENVVKLKTHFE